MTLREFASNNSTNNRASRLFVCCRQKRKRKDDTSGLNRFLIFLNGKLTLLFRYKQGPAFIFPGWRVVFVQGAKVASGPVSYTSILTWTMTTKMLASTSSRKTNLIVSNETRLKRRNFEELFGENLNIELVRVYSNPLNSIQMTKVALHHAFVLFKLY